MRKAISPDLVRWVTETGGEVVREPGGALVVTEIMLFADAGGFLAKYDSWIRILTILLLLLTDKTEAIKTLLQALAVPYPSSSDTPHPIDLPHTSRLYKTLIQGGHFNHGTSRISLAPSSTWDRRYFATQFVQNIGQAGVVGMCTKGEGNGAFVVAELCGALVADETGTEAKEREEVKKWFDNAVRREIQEGEAKGKKVLLEKIALLK